MMPFALFHGLAVAMFTALLAGQSSPALAGQSGPVAGGQPGPVARASLPATSSLVVTQPADGSYVSGLTLLQAVTDPADLAVERVTFYADGRVVCAPERRPFECHWDAGEGVREHVIRVVAQLRDGGRLVRNVRTKDAGYAETVDVDTVQVAVTVTGAHGAFVRNLPRERFRVFESDRPQVITGFASENVPLDLTVAVDMSGSMREAMPQVKAAVKKFLSALRPQDAVTLMAFNDNIFTIARPSATLDARLKAIDRLSAWGGTVFYEVIVRAIEEQGRKTGRRAVVIFTDGEDRNSHVTMAAAEARIEASDSLLYVVGLGQGAKVAELKAIIERLAAVSGGREFFADKADKLDRPFEEIVQELSNQYLLGYTSTNPAKDDAWRPIRVEVSGDGLHVRSRQGYRAVPPKPGAR